VHEIQRSRNASPQYELSIRCIHDNRYLDGLWNTQSGTGDILMLGETSTNRGPEAADLHALPSVLSQYLELEAHPSRPRLRLIEIVWCGARNPGLRIMLRRRYAVWLFTEKETNTRAYTARRPLHFKEPFMRM